MSDTEKPAEPTNPAQNSSDLKPDELDGISGGVIRDAAAWIEVDSFSPGLGRGVEP
jgi:hypothetical protein